MRRQNNVKQGKPSIPKKRRVRKAVMRWTDLGTFARPYRAHVWDETDIMRGIQKKERGLIRKSFTKNIINTYPIKSRKSIDQSLPGLFRSLTEMFIHSTTGKLGPKDIQDIFTRNKVETYLPQVQGPDGSILSYEDLEGQVKQHYKKTTESNRPNVELAARKEEDRALRELQMDIEDMYGPMAGGESINVRPLMKRIKEEFQSRELQVKEFHEFPESTKAVLLHNLDEFEHSINEGVDRLVAEDSYNKNRDQIIGSMKEQRNKLENLKQTGLTGVEEAKVDTELQKYKTAIEGASQVFDAMRDSVEDVSGVAQEKLAAEVILAADPELIAVEGSGTNTPADVVKANTSTPMPAPRGEPQKASPAEQLVPHLEYILDKATGEKSLPTKEAQLAHLEKLRIADEQLEGDETQHMWARRIRALEKQMREEGTGTRLNFETLNKYGTNKLRKSSLLERIFKNASDMQREQKEETKEAEQYKEAKAKAKEEAKKEAKPKEESKEEVFSPQIVTGASKIDRGRAVDTFIQDSWQKITGKKGIAKSRNKLKAALITWYAQEKGSDPSEVELVNYTVTKFKTAKRADWVKLFKEHNINMKNDKSIGLQLIQGLEELNK